MSNLWFSSDFHFRHHLMLSIRSFNNIQDMNETLINNYNSVVNNKDTVWLLGDIGFGKFSEIEKLLKRLKGHKHLILGNHDQRYRKDYKKSGIFESVSDFKEIKYQGKRISLMHYPIHSWVSSHYEAWHCHGHSHSKLDELNKELISKGYFRWDVGVDSNKYFPVSFDELIEIFKKD